MKYNELSRTSQAKEFFRQKDYSKALNLYQGLAQDIGMKFFQQNINMCIKNIPEQEDGICIVFICDEAYSMPTYVSIYSILCHRRKTFKHVINVLGVNLEKNTINSILSLNRDNFIVKVINTNQDLNEFKFHKKEFHVSTAAILKFNIAEIFSKYEKVLYLDSDMIILNDLSGLYFTPIGDVYAGVVEDVKGSHLYKEPAHTRINSNLSYYFNSGMMLLNLKKMREDKIYIKLLEYRKHGINYFMDQDALNVVFGTHTKKLSYQYNFFANTPEWATFDVFVNFVKENKYKSFESLIENVSILHFTSSSKPWNDKTTKYAHIWHDYYALSSASEKFTKNNEMLYKNNTYYFNKYYYSDAPVEILPCYHELYRFEDIIIKKRYVDFSNIDISTIPYIDSTVKSDIIVSLTTTPDRINHIFPTIYSIVNQTIKPKIIWLCLAEDEFDNKKNIPQEIQQFYDFGLTVKWIPKSMRSYNKLLPALINFPDSIIVTCDDDIFYKKTWLETLYTSYKKDTASIHSLRTRVVEFDKNIIKYKKMKFSKQNTASYKHMQTGVGGVLYPPYSLHSDVSDYVKIVSICPTADDIWFWAMAIINNTKIRSIQPQYTDLIYTNVVNELVGDTLSRINVNKGANDIQLENIIKKYPQIIDLITN